MHASSFSAPWKFLWFGRVLRRDFKINMRWWSLSLGFGTWGELRFLSEQGNSFLLTAIFKHCSYTLSLTLSFRANKK